MHGFVLNLCCNINPCSTLQRKKKIKIEKKQIKITFKVTKSKCELVFFYEFWAQNLWLMFPQYDGASSVADNFKGFSVYCSNVKKLFLFYWNVLWQLYMRSCWENKNEQRMTKRNSIYVETKHIYDRDMTCALKWI